MRISDYRLVLGLFLAMVGGYLLNLATMGWLNSFGIIPRSMGGLIGIVSSPFLHASFFHLLGNVMTFVPLAVMTAWTGKRNFEFASLFIIVIGGLLTWLMGRDANHIGASGWIFGLWAFVVTYGIFKRDIKSIVLAILVVVLFTGLPLGLIPRQGISFEGHIFGMIAGFLAARLLIRMNRLE
ncbi:rhomboid family intramembrane serine protease [Pseudomonas putida]|uniref:Rhomboid family intramembrane serine protease n=1 Tax=Pseudomonas putida TaxID=303 RepID=A0A8I1EGN2_PSEPU|nr:rhomboid family intramembrane serine protease [Pseudomonas putida]MBI6885161.1 rhomboid family intramembrane serine protease [Pseudomonas putida]